VTTVLSLIFNTTLTKKGWKIEYETRNYTEMHHKKMYESVPFVGKCGYV